MKLEYIDKAEAKRLIGLLTQDLSSCKPKTLEYYCEYNYNYAITDAIDTIDSMPTSSVESLLELKAMVKTRLVNDVQSGCCIDGWIDIWEFIKKIESEGCK